LKKVLGWQGKLAGLFPFQAIFVVRGKNLSSRLLAGCNDGMSPNILQAYPVLLVV
jgi:hypothetical protein